MESEGTLARAGCFCGLHVWRLGRLVLRWYLTWSVWFPAGPLVCTYQLRLVELHLLRPRYSCLSGGGGVRRDRLTGETQSSQGGGGEGHEGGKATKGGLAHFWRHSARLWPGVKLPFPLFYPQTKASNIWPHRWSAVCLGWWWFGVVEGSKNIFPVHSCRLWCERPSTPTPLLQLRLSLCSSFCGHRWLWCCGDDKHCARTRHQSGRPRTRHRKGWRSFNRRWGGGGSVTSFSFLLLIVDTVCELIKYPLFVDSNAC